MVEPLGGLLVKREQFSTELRALVLLDAEFRLDDLDYSLSTQLRRE